MTGAFIDAYDVAFFDLDGVIYLGPQAVAGAPEGVEQVRARGVRVIFVTNNAARSAAAVAQHLVDLGFETTVDDLVTSAQAAEGLLRDELAPGSKVLVAGTVNLADHVRAAGMVVVDSAADAPAAVIQGYDPAMTWPRLDQAALAVQGGARWFATNTDSTRPTEHGLVPGAGTAIAAVRATVDHDPIVVGKPHPPLLTEALRRTGAQRPVFVGDRIDTDIMGAVAVGMDSFFVFTGAHGKRDLVEAPASGRPTAIGWDVPALLEPRRTASVAAGMARCGDAVAEAVGGEAVLSGPTRTRDQQLDALWAVAQLAWNGDVSTCDTALATLNLVQ